MSSANMNLGVLALLFFGAVFTAADNAYNMTCYTSPTFNLLQSTGKYVTKTCSPPDLGGYGILACFDDPGSKGLPSFNDQCNYCCQTFMIAKAATTTEHNQVMTSIDYAHGRCTCNCCLYTKN